ncbi:IS6 family transposase [archaeon]|nr:MAG: IS6 family transposase [archaeon]
MSFLSLTSASNSNPSFHPASFTFSGGITTNHLGYTTLPTFLDNCFCNFIQNIIVSGAYKSLGTEKYIYLRHLIYSMENRTIKGYEMLANGNMPSSVSKETFLVPSQSSDKKYKVTIKNETSCSCPDFKFRNVECKHIISVKLWMKLREKISSQDTLGLENELIGKPACSYCKSMNIKKNGNRKTESGIKQRFVCLDCHKAFIEESEFSKIKANPKVITLCMDLYYKGLSLRDITDTLNQFFSIQLHHETVRRWVLKFSQQMSNYVDTLHPKLGDTWHIDEQAVDVGGKWHYNFNAIDSKTRFLISSKLTKKDVFGAWKFMNEIRDFTRSSPKEIITDGWRGYGMAVETFNKGKAHKAKHISIVGKRHRINNNMVERYHSTFRERDKVMRGFKAEKSAETLTEGFRTYYNFIRPHMSLEMTPAEKSGISLDLDRNRWLSLLRMSLENKV